MFSSSNFSHLALCVGLQNAKPINISVTKIYKP